MARTRFMPPPYANHHRSPRTPRLRQLLLVAVVAGGCGSRSGLLGGRVDGVGTAATGGSFSGSAPTNAGAANGGGPGGGALVGGSSGSASFSGAAAGGRVGAGGVPGSGVAGSVSFGGSDVAGESSAGGAAGGAPPSSCSTCPDGETCVIAKGSAACRTIDIQTPRPKAPLSTSTVTSQRPIFSWQLSGQDDGAQVDVCRDRACAQIVSTFSAQGASGAPAKALDPGLYFWRLRGTEGELTGADVSAVWQLTVPARDTPRNTSWGTTFDGNGDGFADVLVGTRIVDDTAGVAYLYDGSSVGLAAQPTATLANAAGYYGAFVTSGGDFNGDGYADLIVGCPDAKGSIGTVMLYPGSASGPLSPPSLVTRPMGQLAFGGWVSAAGDLNGDGYGDALVSAVSGTTSVYVYLGGPNGLTASATVLSGGLLVAITTASDVNGDGFSDVVVARSGASGGNQGEVAVYLGSATGLATTPSLITLNGDTHGYLFYVNLSGAGDVNGDGFGDIVVGVPNMGLVSLYLGSAQGLVAGGVLANPGTQQTFGERLAGVGDINGDGFDDVVLGAPGFSDPAAYVYFGNANGLSTPPTVLTPPVGGVGSFADPVAGAGDINGDGFADVLIGGLGDPGSVYVYFGGKNGLGATPATLSSPANTYRFAESLALLAPATRGLGRAVFTSRLGG